MLQKIDRLSKDLKKIPEIKKIRSITTAQDIKGSDDGFDVSPFLEKILDLPEDLAVVRRSAMDNPLYKIDFFSKDGKIACLLIEAKVSKDEGRYKKIYEQILAVMRESPLGVQYYIAGDPLVELQMTRDMLRDLKVFIPLTYLVLIVLLLALYRDPRFVIGPVVTVTAQLLFLFGLMGACGIPLNSVTSGLPSLLLCISILEATHILSLYRVALSRGLDKEAAITEAVRMNLNPCFWTSITTVLGFGAVAASDLIPIKQFGFLAAVSSMVAVPLLFLILPAFMAIASGQKAAISEAEKNTTTRFFTALSRVYSRRTLMICLMLAALIISIIGVSKIKTETMLLNSLRKDSPTRVATDFIESNLGGVSVIEIFAETGREDGIKDPAFLTRLDRLQEFLMTVPNIDKTISPVQFIKEMHQAMNGEDPAFYFIPDSEELIAQYLLTYSFSGRDNDLDKFMDYNYSTARITVRIKETGSAALKKKIELINDYIQEHFPAGQRPRVTSYSVIQANMVEALVEGQKKGFVLEFIFMFLIFLITNRGSWVVAGLALVPNLLPILGSLALMGYAGITMNAGTAMTCCIVFGLVVDDTIHFLEHARHTVKRVEDPRQACIELFRTLGPAVIFASIILAAGFLILVFGHSFFTVSFGLICAFAIFSAMICELFVTPFFILHVRRFREDLKR